jgi:RHS repeat-associated protein
MKKSITGAATRTMTWHYDYAGRVQRLTYPYPDASQLFYVDYAFHPGTGLLHTATGSDGTVYATMTGYQPLGKIGVLDFGNSVRTTYGYDEWSQRLTSIYTAGDQGGGNKHQDRQYYYSKAGDIEQIDDLAWVETYYYSYDKLHRLTSETTSSGSLGVIPGIYEMQYDDPDHIHAVSSVTARDESHGYTYDPNGNMTDGPDLTDVMAVAQRSLAFNADNMPTQVVLSGGGTVDITYDGEAKRAKKSGPGGTTYYYSNEFEQIGATETCYVFAGNLRVAMIKDYAYDQVKYFHKDHLGSSSVVTDADGVAQEKTRYMPFGGKRGEGTGITASNYLFTDQELDKESGLYNYDARLYDPIVGRFISADSVVPDLYDSQAYDRYVYCVNNPLIYVDPTGHKTYGFDISGTIGAFAALTGGLTGHWDDSGNIGLSLHGGGGPLAGATVSGALQGQVTDANTIDETGNGKTTSAGGSVLFGTAEAIFGDDYAGINAGLTVGLGIPVEGHVMFEGAVGVSFNLPDLMNKIMEELFGWISIEDEIVNNGDLDKDDETDNSDDETDNNDDE